jgi:DNA adenine methylase
MTVKSPLKWVGGKFYAAPRIVAAFPPARDYDTYVETCGGAAHVLFAKAPARHKEVYADLNGDLCNFWMQARDHAHELADRLRTLPYARAVYYHYYRSLFDGTEIEPFERAVRWFYVLRSTSTGWIRPSPVGWNHIDTNASAYRSVVESFEAVQARMSSVLIDNRDFERTVEIYDAPRTLFYVDPPYINAEMYYHLGDFDHERLAEVLNNVRGKVCLSYYPHEKLDRLYPADRWHRQTWHQQKRSSIQHCEELLDATEMLLCNYWPQESLWTL